MRLVTPQPHNFRRGRDAFVGSKKQPLENIGQISQVENVMELDSSGHEYLGGFEVQRQSCIDDISTHFADQEGKLVAWSI